MAMEWISLWLVWLLFKWQYTLTDKLPNYASSIEIVSFCGLPTVERKLNQAKDGSHLNKGLSKGLSSGIIADGNQNKTR